MKTDKTTLRVFTKAHQFADGTAHWIRIGYAEKKPDGDIEVTLHAVPVNGSLLITKKERLP